MVKPVEKWIISYDKNKFKLEREYYPIEEEHRFCNSSCIMKDTIIHKTENKDLHEEVWEFLNGNYNNSVDTDLRLQVEKINTQRKELQRKQYTFLMFEFVNKYPEKIIKG